MGWARRQVLAGLAVLGLAMPAFAAPDAADLAETLKIGELAGLMQAEGLAYADDIEAEMLPGGGGALWRQQVREIYARDRIVRQIETVLGERLDEEARADVQAFFGTEQGQRILTLENSARAAMADEDVEATARDAYAAVIDDRTGRLAQIDRFVEANDLLERNVASALGTSYQFFRGMADGGSLDMGDEALLADVWGREPEIREDTETWLYAYLLMAFGPLDDAAVEDYIAFSETSSGRALNAALFEGFGEMYRDISYALGRAAAVAMAGSDL